MQSRVVIGDSKIYVEVEEVVRQSGDEDSVKDSVRYPAEERIVGGTNCGI